MRTRSKNSTDRTPIRCKGDWRWRLGLAAIASLAIASGVRGATTASVTTTVGIEGVYYLRHRGPVLEAKPLDERAPIKLRISSLVDDDDDNGGGAVQYELRFIGNRPGRYDLGEFLQRVDGEEISGLPPAIVQVDSVLPADHDGQLQELAGLPRPEFWSYRGLLIVVVSTWMVAGVWMLLRRVGRRSHPRDAVEREPTLADLLYPLVEAAAEGSLSAAQQARLEMLLIGYWRDRLDLRGCSSWRALEQMQEHAEAGALLAHLQRWLHQPPGREAIDVAEMVAPYRSTSAREVGPRLVQEASP